MFFCGFLFVYQLSFFFRLVILKYYTKLKFNIYIYEITNGMSSAVYMDLTKIDAFFAYATFLYCYFFQPLKTMIILSSAT